MGQEDPSFRVETRVVTVNAMVRDAETRQPVRDLSADNFRLFIDGKEKKLTYFRHEGEDRRPLALLVYFNLAAEGARRQLSQEAAQQSFAQALGRLAAEDEVAVFAATDWFVGKPELVSPLTKDRAESASALAKAVSGAFAKSTAEQKEERAMREQSMTLAIERAREIALERPQSHVALVYVSDGMNTLDMMEAKNRKRMAEGLEDRDISFSTLTVDMLATYASAAAVINPLGAAFGLSVSGGGKYLAKQSGGVSVEVNDSQDLGGALEKVLSAYASRYSLGYQVADGEYRQGRTHKIEVRLNGAKAKLEVSARKSFRFPPSNQLP